MLRSLVGSEMCIRDSYSSGSESEMASADEEEDPAGIATAASKKSADTAQATGMTFQFNQTSGISTFLRSSRGDSCWIFFFVSRSHFTFTAR